MNDFQRQWREIRQDALRVLDSVGESGWYILGERVRAFERKLAAHWGLPLAVGVASGLDALEISLKAVGLRPGDKALTTPLSAFATTMAIVRLGGVPVFCDTDEQGLIDLNEADAVCRAMPEIDFIVPVHLYGFPLNAARLERLCERVGLTCVEDCAQSIGAMAAGRATGLTGVAAATSFYPTKNLGAMGDGGAVLVRDPELASRIRKLRDYGQSGKYRHAEIGYNSRLDELQAALLTEVYLPRLEVWTENRRAAAERYRSGWKREDVRPLPLGDRDDAPCWHLFPVRVAADRKASLMDWLRGNGIGFGEHYPVAIPDQPAMRAVTHVCYGPLANARRLAAEEISLPIHPFLDEASVDEVLRVVEAWPR